MNETGNYISPMDGIRGVIVGWAIIQSILTIAGNLTLLIFSCKIKEQSRNQLHVAFTVLAVSDLINGITLFILAIRYYFGLQVFNHFNFCFILMLMTHTGVTTTGYMILLLSLLKCISIMSPLKSLRYITRDVTLAASAGVWIFCYFVVTISFVLWRADDSGTILYCGMTTVLGDNHKTYATTVGLALGIIFSAGFVSINAAIVLTITERGKRIGAWISAKEKPQVQDKQPITKRENDGATAHVSTISPSINLTNVGVQPNTGTNNVDQAKTANDRRRSQNFKAYKTVLLHTLAYMMCGLPTLIVAGNKSLKWYFYNDVNVIFFITIFAFLTSLVNPMLTIFGIPAFQKVAKNSVRKLRRSYTFNRQQSLTA